MKKRLRFTTLLKRTFLGLLLIAIVIVVLVFIFDKYTETENVVENKYPDSYWTELKDFVHSDEIHEKINKYDQNHPDYVLPIDLGGKEAEDFIKENPGRVRELILAGRYDEEIYSLTKSLENEQKKYANELRGLEYVANWDFTRPVEEWISERFGLSLSDYEEEETTLAPYAYAVDSYFTGTEAEFVKILQQTDSASMERTLKAKGFDGYLEGLAYSLYHNPTYYKDVLSVYDEVHYQEVVAKAAEYNEYIELRDAHVAECNAWEDYYKEDLLGFGGLATDYPGQPVLTSTTESGGTLEFWLNYYYTSFKLVEKDADGNILQTWYSNPEYNSDENANQYEIKVAQQSILNLSYAVLSGQTGVYSTYEYSVSETNLYFDELTPNYSIYIEKDENGKASKIIVWYKLVKRAIDYTYFPKYISKTKMDEYLARNAELAAKGDVYDREGKLVEDITTKKLEFVRLTKMFYKLIPTDDQYNEFGYDYYEFDGTHAAMSGIQRNFFLKYLYDWCGYTEEDLINDNYEFNYETNLSKPEYEVAIEYTLNENGLDVCVPGNSIKEDEKFPLNYIDVLPYFTATKNNDENGNPIDGYTIIPDGSGAVLEHNNGKYTYSKYQKRVYTTDLTKTSIINTGSFEELMFPMYAVVNTGNSSGIIAHSTGSAAQMQLTADIAGRQDSYNVNYFTAYLREMKQIVVGTASYEQKTLEKWTNARNENDIAVSYSLLASDELQYSVVAKKYREILEKQYGLVAKDNTVDPVLDIDVLGAYTYQDNFLGIPYTAKDTLTTIEQLEQIVKELNAVGVKAMNVFYLGWRDTGLVPTSFKKIKVSPLIGSKNKFKELLKNTKDNVTVYPYVSFGEYEKYQESFGQTHYTTHAVDGDVVFRQPYDLNSNIYDKTKAKIYALSPRYYLAFGQTLAKNFKKATDDYNALAIEMLGSSLAGEYRKGKETFKVDAVRNQIATLDYIYKDSKINNLTLYTPYDYAFKYVTVAKEIPYQATQYEILDYSIPFYQLVVNGLFDYSGESVNANIGKGVNEHIMRMIETGSNISFTFTGDSSEKLIQTDYNNYYYTLYSDWVEDVKTIYSSLAELDIYSRELVYHEYLGNNIYKVTYKDVENSADEGISIYLNYSRNTYVAPDGTIVESKNYKVAE